MCGILAWYQPAGLEGRQDLVETATAQMMHRGPDGGGVHVEGPIALGHRRLSIIDLDSGQQPMFDETGDLALVYNGEIYNFLEIRERLEKLGHTFKTRCDTEVILRAYREWDTDCVEHFNGMFAFALWDRQMRRLWVVRDRMGIKPLYYWSDKGQFACASEIKPLFALDLFPREFNEKVVDAYLTLGYVPAPETMFQGVRKLEPGCFLEVTESGIRETRYWDFCNVEPLEIGEDEARERLLELLSRTTKEYLISDVPLGVFLSGGLDSSAMVALMDRSGVDPINSFTAGFRNAGENSEEGYARTVAAQYRCRHFVHHLESGAFMDSLKTLVLQAEEPVVEPAAIALYHLAKLARSEVTVLLSGEGSDEVFAGYGLYRRMLQLNRWRSRIPQGTGDAIPSTLKRRLGDKQLKYLDWITTTLRRSYQGTSANLTPSLRQRFYKEDFARDHGDYLENAFNKHFNRVSHLKDPLAQMQYVDSKTWLPDDLLLKADKMTMAASVELRVPFLDHHVVEFAASLPAGLKMNDGQGKWILKKSLEGLLPEEIIYRKKMGFPVPTGKWFASNLRVQIQERLCESDLLPWIRRDALFRLTDEKGAGQEVNDRMIMALLVLQVWREEYWV